MPAKVNGKPVKTTADNPPETRCEHGRRFDEECPDCTLTPTQLAALTPDDFEPLEE